MCCKIRIYRIRNPGCTGIHKDILISHILRHNCLQSFHILLVVRIHRNHSFCITELCTDISGQINFSGFQTTIPVLENLSAVDQLSDYICFRLSGQLCNQGSIHAAGLVYRYNQALGNILGRGNSTVWCNGILGEDIRLGSLLCLGIVVFQCKDRELVRIILNGIAVCLGIDKSVLLHKGIIGFVQLLTGFFDFGILQSLLLISLQFLGGIPDFQKSGNTLCSSLGGIYFNQRPIQVLIDFASLGNITIVLCLLICSLHGEVGFLRALLRRVIHLALNVFECLPDLVCQAALAFQRFICKGISTIHTAGESRCTQNHFGMVGKVAIHILAVIGALYRVAPRRFEEVLTCISSIRCSLLQNQDIRYNLSAGISLESRIRKTDSTQKVRSLHDIAANRRILGIHGVAGCDEHHNAAGSYLIQALCKEVIVNCAGYFLWIGLVCNGIVTKGNIANCNIHKVIGDLGFLKALDAYICIGVKVFGNQTGNAVQLYHSPAAYLCAHICRHSTHKVTNTGRRLHHSAAGKAQLIQAVIHSLDNRNIGVMSVQGGTSCAAIFLIGKQFLQLRIFLCPFCLFITKGIGKAAPAHILGKDHLLSLSRIAPFCFQLLYNANSFHIGLIPGLFAVGQIQAVTDDKVSAFGFLGRLLGDLLSNFLMELFSLFARDICVLSRFVPDIYVGYILAFCFLNLGILCFLMFVDGFFYFVPVGCLIDNNRVHHRKILFIIDIDLHHSLLGSKLVDCNSVPFFRSIFLSCSMGS